MKSFKKYLSIISLCAIVPLAAKADVQTVYIKYFMPVHKNQNLTFTALPYTTSGQDCSQGSKSVDVGSAIWGYGVNYDNVQAITNNPNFTTAQDKSVPTPSIGCQFPEQISWTVQSNSFGSSCIAGNVSAPTTEMLTSSPSTNPVVQYTTPKNGTFLVNMTTTLCSQGTYQGVPVSFKGCAVDTTISFPNQELVCCYTSGSDSDCNF